MLEQFLYVGLPYAALFVFLIGSIIRVRYFGLTVTSHSSQFFETRLLYWGSRFFHIGIIAVLAGHLIGFIAPSLVINLTRIPLGLTIIESAAFSFAVLALIGISILMYRRIVTCNLYSVTTVVDIFVYLIIVIQIIGGLLVAYYNRWGSSWYASSLVPYLKSLFMFTPDVKVIIAMPLLIKIHTISAFIFLGLIPFSRLIHFLVYPISYFFRSYILVIWNRDMRARYFSNNMREGKKPRNN